MTYCDVTFRALDGNRVLPEPRSALEQWYLAVRDVPLRQLGVPDLARAIRQGLFTDQLVPIAIDELTRDPLAGELYDGELVAAVAGLAKHQLSDTQRDRLRSILDQIPLGRDDMVDVAVSKLRRTVT